MNDADLARYESFTTLSPNLSNFDCSILDRTCRMQDFVSSVSSLLPLARVALDISVFTKPYFFAILRGLKDHLGVSVVDVFYTEPASYLKSSRGSYEFADSAYELVDIPGFPGAGRRRDLLYLLVLLGFDGSAASYVQSEVGPVKISAVNGFPSYILQYKDTSVLQNASFLTDPGVRKQIRYAPASDPFETYNEIDALCRETPSLPPVLAPLGTKPMALGAAMYALHNDRVRVTYPAPQEYTNKFSHGLGKTWLYRIPL